MKTFLIFIALFGGVMLIRSLFANARVNSMRKEVMNDLEKESPGFKREFQQSQTLAKKRAKREELYLAYMTKKNYELGFDWKSNCHDDERWNEIEPEIKRFLNV